MISGAPAQSRGVALITALLVVALASVAAVAMANRQQLDIRRAANILHGDQATLYARGVETWALQILTRDRKDTQTDHPGEDWATILPPLAVEGGEVSGYIEDMQARFNLNNLTQGNTINEAELVRFRRLLETLDVEPNLANAVIDWIDPNLEPRFPNGAEEDEYLRFEPPYRNANRPLASVSELRLIKGVDGAIYERLAPYVAALPTAATINVNTAPVTVLRSLADGLTESDAESLVEARGEDGFASVEDFLKQDVLAGRTIEAEGLSVNSTYFRVHAETRVGRVGARLVSLVERPSDGPVRVIMRSRAGD
jgi:general secretion pathway protein K